MGFANNSSSTHSILLDCNYPAVAVRNENYEETIHLKSKEGKEVYFGQVLFETLPRSMPQEQKYHIIKELLGIDKDHQIDLNNLTGWEFSKTFQGGVNEDFIRDFKKFIIENPRYSLGGSEYIMPDWAEGKEVLAPYFRYDHVTSKRGDWYLFFNRKSGGKMRFSFLDDPKPYRINTPELIDLKITDFCNHGCSFCYQASTTRGQHAELGHILNILDTFEAGEVLEVAFGGGETTSHPDFARILRETAQRGIVPNFTTFNMDFTKDPVANAAVLEHCGSFAMSSLKEDDLEKFQEWHAALPFASNMQGTIQIPMGCYSKEQVRNALTIAANRHIPVTLLGYKDFGRGIKFKQTDYSWALNLLTQLKIGKYGADTLFVKQFYQDLIARKVAPELMVTEEGTTSCYIDAVTDQMGACSYTKAMHPLDLENIFSKFPYKDEDTDNPFNLEEQIERNKAEQRMESSITLS